MNFTLNGLKKACFLVLILALGGLGCHSYLNEGAASVSCIYNLRQIDGAKQMWATAYHKATNDIPTWEDFREYFGDRVPLKCPNGGTYTIGHLDELPTCSIPGDTAYWRKSIEESERRQ